jgi:hypothetical protein
MSNDRQSLGGWGVTRISLFLVLETSILGVCLAFH